VERGANVISERLGQPKKQKSPIALVNEGIQIAGSKRHVLNADSPRIASRESDSKTTVESRQQRAKHNFEMISTDRGIQIVRSDVHFSNADSPRVETMQSGAKVTSESRTHSRKQPLDIVAIDEGMQIE
jgi:hypothetical protein